jgi:hypothetical protein
MTTPDPWLISMPEPRFPAITLRAPAALPPITALLDPPRSMPWPLGIAKVPLMSVPIRFPWMIVPSELSTRRPTPSLPEIRFRDEGEVPPIWLLFQDRMRIPWSLARSTVPVASVPM